MIENNNSGNGKQLYMLTDNGQVLQQCNGAVSNGGGNHTSKKKKGKNYLIQGANVGFMLAGTQMHETTYAKVSEPNINDRSQDLHLDTSQMQIGPSPPQTFASHSNGFQNINIDELKAQVSELQLPGINKGSSKGSQGGGGNSRPSSKQYIANQKSSLYDPNSQSHTRLRQNGITAPSNIMQLGSNMNEMNDITPMNSQLQAGVVLSIQRIPPRPHLHSIQRTSGNSTGSHTFKAQHLLEANSSDQNHFNLVNQHNTSQMSQSVYKDHLQYHPNSTAFAVSGMTSGTSMTTHQTPLQQKRKAVPIDHDKGIMTTGNKAQINPQYNHMFNKTVRSGNGNGSSSQDNQFYNESNNAPPTSASAAQHMLVNYSIKGMGQGSLTKLSKRFSANGPMVEGLQAEQKNLQSRFISMNQHHLSDPSELSESPPKVIKMNGSTYRGGGIAVDKTVEIDYQLPQTPTKGIGGGGGLTNQEQLSQVIVSSNFENQSCPATIKRQKVSVGSKTSDKMLKQQGVVYPRHSVVSQVSQESAGGSYNMHKGGPPTLQKPFDQQSLIIKPIKRITFTDKQQTATSIMTGGSQQQKLQQQSFQRENYEDASDTVPAQDTYNSKPVLTSASAGGSPEPVNHQRYNSMQLRANSELKNDSMSVNEFMKSQDHGDKQLFKQFTSINDQEENGRNVVNPFGAKKVSNQSFTSYMQGANINGSARSPQEELRSNFHHPLIDSSEPITIENQVAENPSGRSSIQGQQPSMKQIQMRFGTSSAQSDSDRGTGGGFEHHNSEGALVDSHDDHDELQHTTTTAMLGATTGENQLIGILEEDSEDFDEEDEDDPDEDADGDDDMLADHQATRDRITDNDMDVFDDDQGPLGSSGNAFGETMHRKELLFGVNGEDIIEEEMQSDDEGPANGMDDSDCEEFERNQSGDEIVNAGNDPNIKGTTGHNGKSEKKKKKKKDNNGNGGTATTSPTKTSKKDKKKKDNQAQQQQINLSNNQQAVASSGTALNNLLSPQIKIMIQNKLNSITSSSSKSQQNPPYTQDQKLSQKSNSLKMSGNNNTNPQSQQASTPNQQLSKGKAEKLSLSLGKSGIDTNQLSSSKGSNSLKDSNAQAPNASQSQQQVNNQGGATIINAKEQKKRNKQKNVALIHSMPKNLEEEQQRFFENECKVNPIFDYENPSQATKYLSQFKEANDEYMQIAKNILDGFLQSYGSESNYLVTEGNILTQEETEKYFMDYLDALGVADQVILNFCRNKVAPTSVTHDPKGGKSKINIGLPIEYRQGRIMGVLHHEIGTHFLRKYNEKFQVWYKKREKYELKNCIQTEEGFASINQLFEMCQDESKQPFLFKAALNYYSAYMASKMSFVDLFNDLEKYIDNPRRRWKCCVRVKRGIQDTGEPGGLYKDQVYLEGAIQILQDRQNIDFLSLYCGKISLEDLKRPMIEKRIKKEGGLILPTFMSNMEEYNKSLDIIAKTNYIQ